MHYATGADGLSPAPFVLDGTTQFRIDGAKCEVCSSVVLPNGAERVVTLSGELCGDVGGTVRLEGDGPIALLLSEHGAARSLLIREVNRTSDEPVLTGSIVLLEGSGGGALELLQHSHELRDGAVCGVQMWRMRAAESAVDFDMDAFMYSGSEL